MANVLLAHGVRKGDRVCIYMPMIPETAFMMLACARIGAIHSVVFGGFSGGEPARPHHRRRVPRRPRHGERGRAGGKRIPLAKITDRAVEGMSIVETVLVARRTDADVPMTTGRDHWLDEVQARQRSTSTVEWMGSEDPLFILC